MVERGERGRDQIGGWNPFPHLYFGNCSSWWEREGVATASYYVGLRANFAGQIYTIYGVKYSSGVGCKDPNKADFDKMEKKTFDHS